MTDKNLKEITQPLRSALNHFSKTELGQELGYSTDQKHWQDFRSRGLWHLAPLCAVSAWDDMPGTTPYGVCLRIDLRQPTSAWPIVLADKKGQCTTLASRPQHLVLALHNDRSTSSNEFWEQYNDLWRELHIMVGGQPTEFDWLGQQIADGKRVRLSTDAVDQQAAKSFEAILNKQAAQQHLVPETSPWFNSVNSRVFYNLTQTSLQQGNNGYWNDGVFDHAIALLKSPNSFDNDKGLTSLRASLVSSAWYYLYGSIRNNLTAQPDLLAPGLELYRKIIEHGAQLGLSGLQHFELAAFESSQNNDQVTAFHHLISAAFWALQNTQTELPETFEIAQHVAELHGNQDAIEALKLHQS